MFITVQNRLPKKIHVTEYGPLLSGLSVFRPEAGIDPGDAFQNVLQEAADRLREKAEASGYNTLLGVSPHTATSEGGLLVIVTGQALKTEACCGCCHKEKEEDAEGAEAPAAEEAECGCKKHACCCGEEKTEPECGCDEEKVEPECGCVAPEEEPVSDAEPVCECGEAASEVSAEPEAPVEEPEVPVIVPIPNISEEAPVIEEPAAEEPVPEEEPVFEAEPEEVPADEEPELPAEKICPVCGTRNAAHSFFCKNCGVMLPDLKEEPASEEIPKPEEPEVPEIPEVPEVPEAPETPEEITAFVLPKIPEVPEVPKETPVLVMPEAPEAPEAPKETPVLVMPEAPEVPEVPKETPVLVMPEVPEAHETPKETPVLVAPETLSSQTDRPSSVPAPDAAPAVFCTNCGTKNLGGSRFCKKCGTRLIRPL